MLQVIDSSKRIIKSEKEIPLDLEKIVLKTDSSIRIDLIEWENAGLRITISVDGLGGGYFNEIPYTNEKIALKKYLNVLKQVKAGNYSLKLYKNNKLKLLLDCSEKG